MPMYPTYINPIHSTFSLNEFCKDRGAMMKSDEDIA